MKICRVLTALACFLLLCVCAGAAENVKIAFIDSGISTKYIDSSRIVGGKNYVFPQNDTQDRIGHGTATAGAVLGSTDGSVIGACPTACAVALVVCDRYPSGVVKTGDVALMCDAVYDAVDEYGCDIINISMGVPKKTPELEKAVLYAEEKGVAVVSAVGNDNLVYPEREYFPAGYGTVIGVGASDGDSVFEISQRNCVDVVAEGKSVPSVGIRNFSSAEARNGTSYSCALVSGLCAEILTRVPQIEPRLLRSAICAFAQDISPLGYDKSSGWGKVGMNFFDAQSVTRGSFIKLVYILNNKNSSSLKSAFADTDGTEFETAAVWAKENKVIFGRTKDSFAPDEFISEAEAAIIINRYAKRELLDEAAATKKEISRCEALTLLLSIA